MLKDVNHLYLSDELCIVGGNLSWFLSCPEEWFMFIRQGCSELVIILALIPKGETGRGEYDDWIFGCNDCLLHECCCWCWFSE